MSNKSKSVNTAEELLKKLQEQFPDIIHGPNVSEQSIRMYFGNRQVIKYAEELMNISNGDVSMDIPTVKEIDPNSDPMGYLLSDQSLTL